MSKSRRRFFPCTVIGLVILISPLTLAAQEDSRDDEGNSPMSGGNVVLSVGGSSYYTGFVNTWGVSLATEVVIGSTEVSHPMELTYGVGASGDLRWIGDQTQWNMDAFGTVHLFPVRNLGIYVRLGLGYYQWNVYGAVGFSSGIITYSGTGGIEYFVTDALAIYVETGLVSLRAGLRLKL